MPSAKTIIRARRRSRRLAAYWNAWTNLLWVVAVAVTIVLGSLSAGMAYLYLDFAQSVPAVEDIQAFFGSPSEQGFIPVRVYDRSGDHLLDEWVNPAAADREWVSLDPADPNAAPQVLIQAILAAQDPRFWDTSSMTPVNLGLRLAGDLFPFSGGRSQLTISEQLAEITLLPFESYSPRSLRRDFRLGLLGERLESQYDKEQILTWYLNSVYFGSMASGVDAASLVYFGKHANQLDLAESALLAGIPGNPEINPSQAREMAERRQGEVIARMQSLGYITQRQVSAARAEKLAYSTVLDQPAEERRADLDQLVRTRFVQAYGAEAMGRGGIRIITTVDSDLQLQAECTLETHLARLSGESPGTTQPAEGDLPCLAAGFLPPIRPSDANVDHDVTGGAALIADPTNGQLLALANSAGGSQSGLAGHSAGQVLSPLIYLTAFARGYAPASMVLDLPLDTAATVSYAADVHGPIRMRTALANVYRWAALRTLALVGPDNVGRTARQLGLDAPMQDEIVSGDGPVLTGQANLLDLGLAYGVLAHNGEMVGVASRADAGSGGVLSFAVMVRVEDIYGRTMFEEGTTKRSVVSAQLAYLVDDVLSDESARWPTLGQGNVLDAGRPAAALASVEPRGSGTWTLGYVPDLTVGVWIGNQDGSSTSNLDRVNGATPVWHALLQYATRDLQPSDWTIPPGVNEVDVCDPSGLLPTKYCPRVVRDVFIQGTEPTARDNLYQPFKIDVETGKLATLFTPLDQVDERVFLVPPPEALAWAQSAGIEQPPQEYDPVDVVRPADPDVNLSSPDLFSVVGGEIRLRGSARSDGFEYYRLQYGKGLNPDQWIQIGEDHSRPVSYGLLATWDARGLNGLYTVQLLVVGSSGQVKTAALPLTLDSLPPEIAVISPASGDALDPDSRGQILIEAEASDAHAVANVTFSVDGKEIGSLTSPPFSLMWLPTRPGNHTLIVHASDSAGNETTTEAIPFSVSP
jgi:membrane peptidoglycan carboxypeptidase